MIHGLLTGPQSYPVTFVLYSYNITSCADYESVAYEELIRSAIDDQLIAAQGQCGDLQVRND